MTQISVVPQPEPPDGKVRPTTYSSKGPEESVRLDSGHRGACMETSEIYYTGGNEHRK